MSLATFNLGYGKTTTVEIDVFTRLLNDQIYDTEEVRCDKPANYIDPGYEYMGVAESGSAIVSPVWACIRRSWVGGKCVRVQFQKYIAWVDREDNWI